MKLLNGKWISTPDSPFQLVRHVRKGVWFRGWPSWGVLSWQRTCVGQDLYESLTLYSSPKGVSTRSFCLIFGLQLRSACISLPTKSRSLAVPFVCYLRFSKKPLDAIVLPGNNNLNFGAQLYSYLVYFYSLQPFLWHLDSVWCSFHGILFCIYLLLYLVSGRSSTLLDFLVTGFFVIFSVTTTCTLLDFPLDPNVVSQ